MLQSIVGEDNRHCANLQSFTSNLKSIRDRMNIVNECFKQLASFDSLEDLEANLTALEGKEKNVLELDVNLAELRRVFDEIINKENSYAENDDDSLTDMNQDLKDLEAMLKSLRSSVEQKIKGLKKIQEAWGITERVSKQLKSEFEKYYERLNPDKDAMLVCYDLFGTDIHSQRSEMLLTQSDLDLITNEVHHFKNQLDTLKLELDHAEVFMHNSFYNSYCLLLDRFWSNLRILSEVLNNNASQGYNQMGLVLNLNQHINDSVLDATNGDEYALQFDPRIDQLSTPRCFNELLAKGVSDKQVATIDEKSSQTEVHHLGLSVDENSQRSLYEIAEEQSPSLNDNKERISQKTQDSGINEVASPKQQEVKKLIDFEPISVRMNLKQCDLQGNFFFIRQFFFLTVIHFSNYYLKHFSRTKADS